MFAFSTHAILGGDCATQVLSALPQTMDQDTRFAVRVCLHEALYNAALHGNLEIDDIHRSGITKEVESRLNNPTMGSRPVYVTWELMDQILEIVVKDFGEKPVSLPTEDIPHRIHGLRLMRQLARDLTFDPKIRAIKMGFCWKEAP